MRLSTLTLVTLLAACGPSAPKPPVIDTVTMPMTATLGANGKYTLTGRMTYHDDDSPVRTLKVIVVVLGQTLTYSYPAGELFIGNINPLTIEFDGNTPKGMQEYDLQLIDDTGLPSAVSKQFVTLE